MSDLDKVSDDDLVAVVDAIPASTPSETVRRTIFAKLPNRFSHHVESLQQLTDWSAAEVESYLPRIDTNEWEASAVPNAEVIHLTGKGESANAIVGFIRVPSGVDFVEHEHLGLEQVYVLQGRFVDGGKEYGPGELATMPAGSKHGFCVLPGADLVYLLVLYDGVRIGDQVVRPGDDSL